MTETGVQPRDAWADGEAYERYVGRWSRLVAREFLGWLAVRDGADWLDVGCGPGTLVRAILDSAAPRLIKGVDRSPGFIERARETIQDGRVSFEVGDAEALPEAAAVYDGVVSGLLLNFVAKPERATAEMLRVAKPGAVVGVYVWDYNGKMELMRQFWDAAVALDPDAAGFHEGSRFPLCEPDPLAALFKAAGFRDVNVRDIEVDTVFRDFDDYWSPFLGGQGPAPTYAMSLGEKQRASLRERIRAGLPIAADGSIPLVARAWAVRGLCPG